MEEHSIYYGKNEFYDIIRNLGGSWNDSKERPILCLIKLSENDNIYWAIPMGNLDHRNQQAKERIQKFLNYKESDIRSCYYHVGRTDVNSIFFISDIVPITEKYIERSYIGKYTSKPYVIKNKKLLGELLRKAKRILSWENAKPNFYRQHITDIKNYLIAEIEAENVRANEVILEEVAVTSEAVEVAESGKSEE